MTQAAEHDYGTGPWADQRTGTGAVEDALAAVIAERVRELRQQLGLTVAHLAGLTGLSKGMLSKIENMQASPSLATLAIIGDYVTEINVTSPTGIRELKKKHGVDIGALLVAAIERKMSAS